MDQVAVAVHDISTFLLFPNRRLAPVSNKLDSIYLGSGKLVQSTGVIHNNKIY